MPKISLSTGNIAGFKGDALVCPTDSEITYRKTGVSKAVFDKAGEGLLKEASAVGFCNLGNTVIAQGYDLDVKHVIFVPVVDRSSEDNKLNTELLHLAVRNAFILADSYQLKTLAIPMLNSGQRTKPLLERLIARFIKETPETKPIPDDEVVNTVMAISKEFEDSSIKEITIYK